LELIVLPPYHKPVWKENILYQHFGPSYIEMAFDIARAADSKAKLCLLDYKISWGLYSGGVWDHSKVRRL
jgi:GH35 family endo-1,4-beta-xylanase